MREGIWSGSGGLYPLKTFFRGNYWPFVCGRGMWGQKKTSGGGGVQMLAPGPGQTAVRARTGGSKGVASLPGGVAERAVERILPEAGARGSRMSLCPLQPSRDDQGPSVQESAKRETTSSTSTLSPPPPPPSVGTSSIRRHRNAAHKTGAVTSVLGKRKAASSARLVGSAARAAVSRCIVGRWVDVCSGAPAVRCGEWDAWLPNLCACLPRALPGLLERRLILFLDSGVEAARDLRQPDFLPFITAALSSLDSRVWEYLLHDSTLPKLRRQRIREAVLRRGLGVVGHIPIPADMCNRYVPDSIPSVANGRFSRVGPPSDKAVVMLHALRRQNLLFPLPPASTGPNQGGGVSPFKKCFINVLGL